MAIMFKNGGGFIKGALNSLICMTSGNLPRLVWKHSTRSTPISGEDGSVIYATEMVDALSLV